MAVWIRTGAVDVGVSDGVVRSADFATLVEACELDAQAAQRLAQAGAEATRIVTEATMQGERRIDEARGECDRIRTQAHEQGLRDAAERWAHEMAAKAFDARHSIQRASDRLAELVSLATQRVIEAEDRDGLYRRALRTVRHLAGDSKTLTLHIGADDAEHARAVVAQLADETGITVPLEVRVDNRLPGGGCVLESDYGVIDASLGLQLEAVKKAIGKAARAALSRMDDPVQQAHGDGAAGAAAAAVPAQRGDDAA